MVRKMQAAMRLKLEKNRFKPHWRSATPDYLWPRIHDELFELNEAIEQGAEPAQVWAEAADVANFIAMIADNYEQEWFYER